MTTPPLADQFDESSPRYFGWRVVAALFLVAVVAWGFGFYGQGVYLAEFSRRFGWPVAALFAMTQTTNTIVLFGACAVFGLSVHNVITFPALIVQREFDLRRARLAC